MHRVSANASSERPVRFLAYLVCDRKAPLATANPSRLSTPGRAIRAAEIGTGTALLPSVTVAELAIKATAPAVTRGPPASWRSCGLPRTHLAEGQAAEDGDRGEAELHRIGEGPIAEGSGADGPPAVSRFAVVSAQVRAPPSVAEIRSKLSPPATGFG